jgi:hypothetical protein
MKNLEKNNKILELKLPKQDTKVYNNGNKNISDEEKKILIVYYSLLKNVS